MTKAKGTPAGGVETKPIPQTGAETKPIPEAGMKTKPMPIPGAAENTVIVAGFPQEIKPTKLKYVRNGTANQFRLIEKVPLIDIIALESGAFGEGDDRDGDKAVMDWLIAATDNEEFVTQHYDEFDVEQILRIAEIFKRINKFAMKGDDSKNAITPVEA